MTNARSAGTMFDFWISSVEAQVSLWTTLSHRVPMLMMGTASDAERTRMVSEKLDAAMESAQATAEAIGRLAITTPAQLMHPLHAMNNVLDVSHAATAPFRRRVDANAKRLTRRKR